MYEIEDEEKETSEILENEQIDNSEENIEILDSDKEDIEELQEIDDEEDEEITSLDDDVENLEDINSESKDENSEIQEEKEEESNNQNEVSIIKMYGEILTDKEYVTNPAIARDEEIMKMILALITPDKSALLVGKPGIGKTALVEGLAYRIHQNDVPDAIKGWRIIKINLPALLGKTVVNGTEVTKLQLLIDEIDNIDRTILFIDEVHLLVAKNGGSVDVDFANMLKPYLDRGRILMIGATTSEEYEAYILRDRAFVRRFIKIDIAEAQGADVVKILLGTTPKFEKKMGVNLGYSEFQRERIFEWIVEYTSEYKRIYEIQNRYPDICLTMISSAFSYAIFENAKTVTLKHIYLAMKNTNSIYDDAKQKAIIDFKTRFADMLEKEGIDVESL